MKRFLLPLIAAIVLPVKAGIPDDLKGKWMIASSSDKAIWLIDTEDVALKGPQIRFYLKRSSNDEGSTGGRDWTGKGRIDCEKFERRQEIYNGISGWDGWAREPWGGIKPDEFAYDLASQFCFLTGVPGYTPEPNPPAWAKKIIQTVQSQPIKKRSTGSHINCDSPLWSNKPQCFD
tara:strand:+ start:112 stop:639 length:528 start_codon:yes stop_codon:yes gene_type:complete